jgi:hypothetical protein
MKSVRRIALVVFLCGVALGYLYQHHWSLRTTRELDSVLKERRVMVEEAARLRAEVDGLLSFGRLEAMWVADGRPPLPGPAVEVAQAEENRGSPAEESPAPIPNESPGLAVVETAQTDARGVRVASATAQGIEVAEADGR